jgi:hypothetical protein
MKRLLYLLIVTLVGVAGCATNFNENHYFQSLKFDAVTGDAIPTNYYRLNVSGYAAFSAARYVSGYYDERAVDLFFNEIKLKPTDPNETRTIFSENLKDPGSNEVIKPLSPNEQNGAFVMVLSTNASAVTNAIGQFAQNQVVADAVTNLTNQDVIRRLRGSEPAPKFEKEQAEAFANQIDQLFALVPGDAQPDKGQVERSMLRIMNAISTAVGKNVPIKNLSDADNWLQEIKK